MKKFIFSVLLASTLLIPALPVAGAATCDPNNYVAGCTPANPSITTVKGILDLMAKIFGFFFAVVVALASVFLLYAAFEYVTSKGEGEKIEKAKTIIIYAVVALIVAGIAYAIPTIVSNFVK